ncbi:type II secretion system protein GspD [Paraburkholderia humisilvae]|uniref:type II secretion system protein GspD n=1 Tax=Paraburkholderia humisilvae TaxID=627669 RepID=UPI00360CE97A
MIDQIVNGRKVRERDEMVDAPFLAGKTVALSRDVILPPALQANVKTDIMFPGRHVSLPVAAERITLATGIPVKIDNDVYLPASALLPRAQVTEDTKNSILGQSGGAAGSAGAAKTGVLPPIPGASDGLSGVQGYSGAAAIDTPMDVQFEPGQMPLSRTLDLIATRLGINWEYDDQKGVIRFYRMVTKTWLLPIKPGSMSYTTAFSGSTMQSNNSNALNTQGQQPDAPIKSEAANISEINSIKSSIQTIMTRAGAISADPAIGSITLTDTKDAVDKADGIMKFETNVLSKMVLVRLQMIQVTTNDNGQAGVNWNAVMTKALQSIPGFQLSSISPVSLIGQSGGVNNSGQIGLNITSGAFNGTSAIVQALSDIGRVSTTTEIPLSIQNRHGLYYNVRTTYSYVSATTPATSTVGGTGGVPGITTSQDQVGFKLMLYPSVTPRNSIDLTISIDQSTLQSLQTFTSGTGANAQSVQLPDTNGEGATIDAIVHNGGTLILTGFEQKQNEYDKRSMGPGVPIIAGGSVTAQAQRTTTIIILSAAVQDADS